MDDRKKTAIAIVAASSLTAGVAMVLLGGCAIYPDGRVASAFDQGAIKAELMKAEKEYGGR